MPGANRHRPPSLLQLSRLIYRHQLKIEKGLARLDWRDLVINVLRTNLRRVLREKETLMKIIEANPAMASQLPRRRTGSIIYDERCRIVPDTKTVDATDDSLGALAVRWRKFHD